MKHLQSFIEPALCPSNFEKEVMEMWYKDKPYNTDWYKKSVNIEIHDKEKRLDPLYNFFLNKVKYIYKQEVQPIQRYWACIHTNEFTKNNWHNHKHSSDVNGVYYVTKDCEIHFKDENNNIIPYFPQQYELIIFSSHIDHMPIYNNTNRFSINIECNLL